jgi:hypothetical protein
LELRSLPAGRDAMRELEGLHRSVMAMHLEREPRSIRVLKEMTRL